ncbi:Altered inheritance of mitochondria protein 6 [Cryptotrichosporon argae]
MSDPEKAASSVSSVDKFHLDLRADHDQPRRASAPFLVDAPHPASPFAHLKPLPIDRSPRSLDWGYTSPYLVDVECAPARASGPLLFAPARRPSLPRLDSRDALLTSSRVARFNGRPFRPLAVLGRLGGKRDRRSPALRVVLSMLVVGATTILLYAIACELLWSQRLQGWFVAQHLARMTDTPTSSSVKRVWGHAHNDEMHGADALILALSTGMGSIEVDVWLQAPANSSSQPVLLAGHEVQDLSTRTLESVYLDPLMQLLDGNNVNPNSTWIGVYKDDPTASVQLVVDVKNEPDGTFDELSRLLEPFVAKNYLTTYNTTSGSWSYGPLTVIGTGDTPIARVYRANPRVIFKDAPLVFLHKPYTIPASATEPAATFEWDATMAPMASSKFPVLFNLALALPPNNLIVAELNRYTAEARRRGIKSRWWGAAAHFGWVRRRNWAVQKAGGADWINGDDLVELGRWLRDEEGTA